MVRLTPELIEDSQSLVNPVREYELRLRGYKIGLIENLGATLNQYDTIDFTDNDIRRLDGFPVLTKLKSLLLSNNKVQHVGSNLDQYLPNLESLILINNNVEDLSEIDEISVLKKLKNLSLLRNPVASLKHYRLYTIYRIPSLRVLDFKRIKEKERVEAAKLYKGKKLKKASDANKVKTFVPGEQLDKLNLNSEAGKQQQQQQKVQVTKEDMEAIRMAISQAKSIEEIENLNAMLRSGVIPSYIRQQHQQKQQQQLHQANRAVNNSQVVEEDDEDDAGRHERMIA